MKKQLSSNNFVYSRDSNFELLRIVCMLFIVAHHFITKSIVPDLFQCYVDEIDWNRAVMIGINYFCFVGVNVFILISGYYGIRFKFRGLLRLYFTCAFYAFLAYIVHLYIDSACFGRSVIYNSVLVFSHNQWWFIGAYLVLFLLSPFINKALDALCKREHIGLIGSFTFISIYLGFIWNTGYNSTGYGVTQMIYMYAIGNYIRKYVDFDSVKKKRKLLIGIYFLCILTMVTLFIFNIFVWHRDAVFFRMWIYTNPLLIIASIAFFILFGTIKFKNRIVNLFASSVLSAYLLPEAIYISPKLYEFGRTLVSTNKIFFNVALVLLWSICVLVLCVLIDKVRTSLMIPFLKVFEKIDNKIYGNS